MTDAPTQNEAARTDNPGPWLVIDASTRELAVGILDCQDWRALERNSGDALENLFQLTRRALAHSRLQLADLRGVLFCAGPGSLLGLRLAAMAVAGWRALPELRHWSLRQYHSLPMAAAARQNDGEHDFHILSRFRREQFNHLPVSGGNPGALGLLDADGVARLQPRVYFIAHGTLNLPPPVGVNLIAYPIGALPAIFAAHPQLFPEVDEPSVLVPEAPVFATWSARRHGSDGG